MTRSLDTGRPRPSLRDLVPMPFRWRRVPERATASTSTTVPSDSATETINPLSPGEVAKAYRASLPQITEGERIRERLLTEQAARKGLRRAV